MAAFGSVAQGLLWVHPWNVRAACLAMGGQTCLAMHGLRSEAARPCQTHPRCGPAPHPSCDSSAGSSVWFTCPPGACHFRASSGSPPPLAGKSAGRAYGPTGQQPPLRRNACKGQVPWGPGGRDSPPAAPKTELQRWLSPWGLLTEKLGDHAPRVMASPPGQTLVEVELASIWVQLTLVGVQLTAVGVEWTPVGSK